MAKSKTKSEIIAGIAEATEITKKQAGIALEELVKMAYKGAKDKFVIPGLGKLVLVQRQARIGRNPATGATINIPAKKVVKFRIAKAAKEAILK
ncbi:MAG: HU family DNA-binding protein [Kiritimatiellae bacterium]|nr:HU family DNA-binding protein [Verrucomicrobiota bacterium]MBU4366351.1 HU family DNA-binding protein [Verrucomicrobiota bacterium]MCG2659474.1 HU family DNA-binding protein [Kiritimatiellia bacterium]